MDYSKGKIYRLVNSDLQQYYGSTIQPLDVRFREHKNTYNAWLKDKSKPYLSSFEVLKGNHVEIELLLECPCNSKKELLECEQVYIENDDCVNKSNAFLTLEQKKQLKKEYGIKYRSKNKEHIKSVSQEYYQNNIEKIENYRLENKEKYLQYFKDRYVEKKEHIKEVKKAYDLKNKDKISQYKKEWALKNKARLKQKATERYELKKDSINEARREKYHQMKAEKQNDVVTI